MRRRPYIRCPMSCVGSMFAAVVESRRQTLTGRWTADFGRSAIVFIIHRSVFRGGRGSFEWTQFVVGGRAASASESEMPAETAARTYNGRYMNTYRQADRQTDIERGRYERDCGPGWSRKIIGGRRAPDDIRVIYLVNWTNRDDLHEYIGRIYSRSH